MSAPAWGNDGRSGRPEKPATSRDRKTGEIGAQQLVDMYFDGSISPAARRALENKIAEDAGVRRDVRATRGVVEKLRKPVAAPDMTDDILRRVSEINGFASARARRRVWGARFAVAACLVGVLGTAVALRAAFPHAPIWSSESRPVSEAAGAGRAEAADGIRTLTTAVDTLAQRAVAPFDASRAGPKKNHLGMGGISRYDSPLEWRIAELPASSSGAGIKPGTVAVFLPDAGETAMAATGSSLAGMIPEVGPDPAVRLRRADSMLKIDRPWWLWTIDAKGADGGKEGDGSARRQ